MIKIDIWLTLPDGEKLQCGDMVISDPDSRGAMKGAFRYNEVYLNHRHAFALDPIILLLSKDEYQTQRPSGVFAVFEDALPDDWGRQLLIRKANLKRGEQTIPRMLEALGANGLGALAFYSQGVKQEDKPYASMMELKALLDAAYRYDAGNLVEEEDLSLLFRAASSPGGARPKALINDDDGIQWIAKFPSASDKLSMLPIEAATLSLATKAGLVVPEFRLEKVGRRNVLMIKRFDVTENGGRLHMISGQTLLGAEGYYNLSYTDLFEAVRKYSYRPSLDIPALFRQMVFNAVVGNTDDHLKNFTMLHGNRGFFLSPAYDLLPDTEDRREHVLFFMLDHLPPNRSTLIKMAKRWGMRQSETILDKVLRAVSRWRSEFKEFGVPKKDVQRLEWSIQRRMKKLR
jgi:serine/threonine-protein kinase HipA